MSTKDLKKLAKKLISLGLIENETDLFNLGDDLIEKIKKMTNDDDIILEVKGLNEIATKLVKLGIIPEKIEILKFKGELIEKIKNMSDEEIEGTKKVFEAMKHGEKIISSFLHKLEQESIPSTEKLIIVIYKRFYSETPPNIVAEQLAAIKTNVEILYPKDILHYIIPVYDEDTHIECINPKHISEKEYQQIQKTLDKASKKLKDFIDNNLSL